jgi:hypothetical protein
MMVRNRIDATRRETSARAENRGRCVTPPASVRLTGLKHKYDTGDIMENIKITITDSDGNKKTFKETKPPRKFVITITEGNHTEFFDTVVHSVEVELPREVQQIAITYDRNEPFTPDDDMNFHAGGVGCEWSQGFDFATTLDLSL